MSPAANDLLRGERWSPRFIRWPIDVANERHQPIDDLAGQAVELVDAEGDRAIEVACFAGEYLARIVPPAWSWRTDAETQLQAVGHEREEGILRLVIVEDDAWHGERAHREAVVVALTDPLDGPSQDPSRPRLPGCPDREVVAAITWSANQHRHAPLGEIMARDAEVLGRIDRTVGAKPTHGRPFQRLGAVRGPALQLGAMVGAHPKR